MRAKPVNQYRSREKRDRILHAMDRLLRRKPFAAISVADLASEAQVSPATIYQRFSNRDATASVLLELYYQRVEEWARRHCGDDAIARAPLREVLSMIARDGLRQVVELGHIMRPAYLYSRHRPDLVGPDWARLEKLSVEGFRALLNDRSDEIRVADVERAAAFLAYFYNMMLLGPLLHDDSASPLLQDSERFATELGEMAWLYLTRGEHAGGEPVIETSRSTRPVSGRGRRMASRR